MAADRADHLLRIFRDLGGNGTQFGGDLLAFGIAKLLDELGVELIGMQLGEDAAVPEGFVLEARKTAHTSAGRKRERKAEHLLFFASIEGPGAEGDVHVL